MPRPESEAVVTTCRTCQGSGRCQTCGGWDEKKKTCVACFYSGRCQKCGGSGKEVISRRF